MPEDVASSLQDGLFLTSREGYCPDLFVGGRPEVRPDNAQELWGNSVQLIYRCLACGLLKLDERWAHAMGISDPESFAEALSQHDPFDPEDFNGDGAAYWLDPLLYATEKTKGLLLEYQITELGADVCRPFISAIAEIFEKQGLAWGKEPWAEGK